jgi:hypothetical protein
MGRTSCMHGRGKKIHTLQPGNQMNYSARASTVTNVVRHIVVKHLQFARVIWQLVASQERPT